MPDLQITTDINPEINPTLAKKTEVDAKAEEIRVKRTLPKKPGDVVTFSEMCDWLKILTPEMMERILLYVYRIEPVINRQLVDPQASNSIDVIGDGFERLSVDYFSNNHGGGKYKIIVFDSGNKDLQRNGFFSANLSIPMLDCPPKLELREVEWDNSKNKGFKSWARAQKLIDENNMPTIEKKAEAPGTQNSDAMVQAMKLAMDFASKMDEKQQAQLKRQLGAEDTLGKSIGDILLEKMKQDDPNKQLTTLTTLLAAMKANQPEPQKQGSELATVMPLLVAMMQSGKDQTLLLVESMKSQQAMMLEMLKGNGKDSGDDTERLKNLLEIAKMMKGGAAAPERTVTEQIIEAASTILPSALNIVGNIMAINASKAGVSGITPAPQPRNGTVSQTDAAIYAASQSAQQPQQSVQQLPPGAPVVTQDQMKMALTQFAPLITQALANSKEGWEFAGDVENLFGAPTVAIMIKDGAEPLLHVVKSIPEFWNPLIATYGEPHLVKWVNSFVNYKEEIAKAMEEDEVEK